MPADTPDYQERSEILTFEEIHRFVRIAVDLGVNDVRLTGGEPLVRAELYKLVRSIASLRDVHKLSLTTNGVLLESKLTDLHDAGLRSVNVSLDALDEASFRSVTRRPGMQKVLDAVQAAIDLGWKVKINAIAMRDFTEQQIQAFGSFARKTGIPIRFIEFMPLDADGVWDTSRVLAGKTIVKLFGEQVRPLVPKSTANAAPSRDYQFDDGIGTIGVISSVTQPFCESCNRFRLTADGQIRNCLFGQDSGDVRSVLRNDASDEVIGDVIRAAVGSKKRGHGSNDLSFERPTRPMYSIGG